MPSHARRSLHPSLHPQRPAVTTIHIATRCTQQLHCSVTQRPETSTARRRQCSASPGHQAYPSTHPFAQPSRLQAAARASQGLDCRGVGLDGLAGILRAGLVQLHELHQVKTGRLDRLHLPDENVLQHRIEGEARQAKEADDETSVEQRSGCSTWQLAQRAAQRRSRRRQRTCRG